MPESGDKIKHWCEFKNLFTSTRGGRFRFRNVDRDLFEMAINGKKTVETRAAEPKYTSIRAGDKIAILCGEDKFVIKVNAVTIFKNIDKLLQKYKSSQINPFMHSNKELKKMYYSFPNYKELIKKYGIIAFELDNRK